MRVRRCYSILQDIGLLTTLSLEYIFTYSSKDSCISKICLHKIPSSRCALGLVGSVKQLIISSVTFLVNFLRGMSYSGQSIRAWYSVSMTGVSLTRLQ